MLENENTEHSSICSFYSFENNLKIREKIFSFEKRISRKTTIIANLLKDICEEGKTNTEEKLILIKPFISKKIPQISINDYIERLLKYSKVSEEIFILVLIYIDRLNKIYNINLNYNNIHKLILVSFVVTIKFHEDEHYSLKFYAKLGGISIKEMINLEYAFLKLLDFKLYIAEELYQKYNNYLLSLENIEDDNDDDDFSD